MNLLRTIAIALTALSRTKTRSLLTVLGVIIGVGAVIAMVAIGEGAKVRVAEQFEAMGQSTLIVTSGSTQSGGVRGGAGSRPTLTWADLAAIAALPEVAAAAPQLRTNAQAVSEISNWQTQVNGTTPAWFVVRSWDVSAGAAFTDADVAGARKVAVVGQTVVDNLFPGVDPIGQTVRIARTPFTVVGVLEPKGTSGFGQDNDDLIVVPTTAFAGKLAPSNARFLTGQIMVMATARDRTADAKAVIEELLRGRHQLRADAADDFAVRDLTAVAKARAASTATITSLLAGVALVSLLVGGIGIMNVMLVSVTERTREIGLRMAVGARPRHIRQQFLIEAVVLSLVGGVVGIAAGVLAGKGMAAKFGFPLLVRLDVVALAVGVAGAVGVVFGWYPAHRAARLDPIVALRHE
ncbi:MAG: ABC transporter permease [Myxococcales bacterium]|nr:ABC transporter permease [Myxococcales bacterium]MBK7191250.1 ABC transporter permease [Myxococcales bacterium]MBP6843245.1 ABC transporter permease [Kofleriaceae bacterium]